MTGLADTVPNDRHPRSCSRWFASDPTTGEAICDCGLAAESTVEGLYQHDLGLILRALGVGDHARSESAHMVVHDVVLPALRAATPRPDVEGLRALRQTLAWLETQAPNRDVAVGLATADREVQKLLDRALAATNPSPSERRQRD